MDANQFAQFLAGFNTAVTNSINAAVQQAQQAQQGQGQANPATPKIAIKILLYKKYPSENVYSWLLQTQIFFEHKELMIVSQEYIMLQQIYKELHFIGILIKFKQYSKPNKLLLDEIIL